MQIQVNPGDVDHSDAIETFVEEQVTHALRHHTEQVTRVEVHLRDMNGPKSGMDKRCMMEVRLAGHDPIAVEDDATSLYDAITQTAGKLQRAVQRKIERHEAHRSTP